ncbi:heavy metal transporter [Bifidobacterium sp. SMB2]|uniref:Heavy metal transporter n=1 Tax=Bifidobacterium saimiriisciurei TaxID=2661627 RepID=A0ABX0CE56_9BIFI|nr:MULTISPECIES: heavy metal transporter [Bifidobacterium]NEG96006.1 heavy metal transporter [Bifidobacterium sp. SMB2]NEH12471.1 heavy metal transporter [Bifidobacterium saimiriisciurei]
MAEEATNADQNEQGNEPHGENPPVDWEAKYRDAVSHSREWEKRAKDNKTAADELEKLKESQLSESEKAAKRIKELEAKNAAYEAERQRNEWKAQVSKETGVPADLLHGDSLESMTEYAKRLDQWAHPKPKGMPDQGRTPRNKPKGQETRDFANLMFSNN